jgi:PAS domain S-box-containing protein
LMGRRMFAAALTVPFVLGWLPILAQRDGLYGTRFGVAVLITGNAAAFALASIVSARAASRLEALSADAQQEARDSHDKLVALIDNTSAVIYIRDLDGRYVLVNREFERLFKLGRANVVGKTDHDLFPAAVAAGFRADDLTAIARGTPIHVEEFVPGDDGEHAYITVKFPLLDSARQAYAVCGISTDITDRKRAEDKVHLLNAELETRVRERTSELETSTRELDAFAYSVSHDLRAPLRSLNGYSEVLLEDYAEVLDETGRGYLDRVQANAARMGQLIDGLLDLSRNSRVTLTRSDVDLHELADEVVADLRAAEPGRAVEIVVADHLRTSADPALIRLVLQNLIGNAWKFSADGTPATIEVGSAEQDGEQVFFVRDNGAGFDMRYAAKLFEPFQRLHGGQEFEGSGLGLAIVQRIIARHGGRIWARGEPGGGAVFSFTTGIRVGALR